MRSFFRTRFSFLSSSNSFLRWRFSFMSSISFGELGCSRSLIRHCPCFGKSLFAPWIPVHRVFRMLEKVWACLIFQMIAKILTSVFQITRCRVVDQLPVLSEAGAVTGAIPGVFYRIPFQRAAQMGTAFGGGRQQADHSLKPVDG